jgi:hypothetical protein
MEQHKGTLMPIHEKLHEAGFARAWEQVKKLTLDVTLDEPDA